VVTDAAVCGTTVVSDAVMCGVTPVTSAALCGTKTITDGVTCGWDWLGSIFGGSSPKSCQVDATCDIPATCEIAASCEIANECEVDLSCEIPKSCAIERCSQATPGGACLPGLAECDSEGFSCQLSADQDVFRCLPNYASDMNVAEEAVCAPLFDANLSAFARSTNKAHSYSAGVAGSVVAASSTEVGTVYGENGEFGCFVSTCVGAQTDVSIAQFTTFGVFTGWSDFAGNAKVIGAGGSLPIIELGVSSMSVVSSDYSKYLGQLDSLSLGVGVVPVALGYLSCNTTVYQVR
jgi:hypothetical protein